jgi:DNA processing protein
MESKEYSYWMALAHLNGIHLGRKMDILIKCFELKQSLSDFFISSDKTKTNSYDLNTDEIECVNTLKSQIPNYAFLAESLLEQGYHLITIWDNEYPKQLKHALIKNSPILLYTKGNNNLLNKDCVAIVGSRKAGDLSLQFTNNIARKSVNDHKVIVSGYAKGVDRQALDSAIAARGESIVVLPQGITTFGSGYKYLYKEIISGKVLILSYFHPNAGWDVGLAMARNSIVYGLAKDIFVAESDNKGGTWNGVLEGLKRQRKNFERNSIFVRIPEKKEKNANNELISMGAIPIDMNGNIKDRNDVVENLGMIENNILNILKNRMMRPEEVSNILKLDWTKEKMKTFLNSLSSKGVVKVKRGRYNCYTIKNSDRNLFGNLEI